MSGALGQTEEPLGKGIPKGRPEGKGRRAHKSRTFQAKGPARTSVWRVTHGRGGAGGVLGQDGGREDRKRDGQTVWGCEGRAQGLCPK